MTVVTLCIPKVHNSITRNKIEQVFSSVDLGKIHSIHFKHVAYHTTTCNMVYIQFASWHNNMWLEHLNKGIPMKIFYDKPRYWICSLSSY